MTRTRRWTWPLVLAGVVALVGGVWGYRAASRAAPQSVEVRARELVQTIVSSGQVMPPAEVRIDSLLTSTVEQILKREGDTVHAGDLLLLLDDSEIRAARAEATAALAQARAGKSSLKVTTLPQANAALAEIRAGLAESISDRERQRQLFAAGVITPSALEKAESAAKIYASQEQAAMLQVQAASRGGSATLTASAAIALAEAQLASVAVDEERARIVAPMDGVITERFVEVGEVVRTGSPLLVLAARGRTRIVLEPDERNLALLALGQKAIVSAEAFPESSFEASLVYIAPAVNEERGTIEVRLDVPQPPVYLRPNMTVSVELSIETRSHSLALPLAAVQDLGSAQPWVGVLGSRGRIERRDVRLGLRGDTLVEISAGLASGERVVFEPPARLSNREPSVGE